MHEQKVENDLRERFRRIDQGCEREDYFEDDKQYLDEYARIYKMFRKRHALLCRLNDDEERLHPRDREKDNPSERLLDLEKTISVQEWLFWEKVDKSGKAGRTYGIAFSDSFGRVAHSV